MELVFFFFNFDFMKLEFKINTHFTKISSKYIWQNSKKSPQKKSLYVKGREII